MTTLEIQNLGGKLFPKVWKINKFDKKEEYTQLTYKALVFKSHLPDSLFTLASLRKVRR